MANKPRNGTTAHDPVADHRVDASGTELTTNVGVKIADNQNSLRAGERGPTLLEDFAMLEKIQHFDHERIPERIVHARGAGAHGYFQVYESMADVTRAAFLGDPSVKTPVFVRFSTVGGSRGSADTARDVRGFAVKFYTSEGNYDLVGNNMPVFFIQDAIKFPDFVHAVKPEPHNEIPQASSAHDTFWDFCGLTTESAHMVLWLMSDRAIPRSLRMMEGFGIHTFRFLNAAGESTYVKFHWKPLLGAHALVWDEAQKLAGKDPDFHRRDLWEAIESGNFPEWELGVQLFDDATADRFDFDILDPTKLVPEELVPVKRIGKMTLDRNPDNYFSETEQVAFGSMHLVPGIDFTNDPLLQGRNFSYQDTQLSRLGGPNFNQIPINQPKCPYHNNQREGVHQMLIPVGKAANDPNSFTNGPTEVPVAKGGFESFKEPIAGEKRKVRADSFKDHYSQAKLFWNSMSEIEKQHIIGAYSFELSKVETPAVRERYLTVLANVDATLTAAVAKTLGLAAPKPSANGAASPTNGAKSHANGSSALLGVEVSPALSMITGETLPITTRKIAFLAADGVDGAELDAMRSELTAAGAVVHVLAPHLGTIKAAKGTVPVDHTIVTMPSVAYDAVYVPGGAASVATLEEDGDAVHFIVEAFKHAKAIAASGEGESLLHEAGIRADDSGIVDATEGVIVGDAAAIAASFIEAIGKHRTWNRAGLAAVPA
jgi:catalase